MSKSIGIFVDAYNQYHAINSAFGASKLMYSAYKARCEGEGNIYRAFVYGIQQENEASPFIGALKVMGYEPNFINYRYGPDVDVRAIRRTYSMVVDIIAIIDRIDVLIIGSNDSYLIPIVQGAKVRGLKVITFAAGVPQNLRDMVSEHWPIQENLLEKKIEVTNPTK